MGYADELKSMISSLKERPKFAESPNQDQLAANRQTAALMRSALTAIAGSLYWQHVFQAARMPDGVGNWETSPRETARAYQRVLSAMVTTQDMGKLIELLKIEVPIR
ncbi:hypothetical protein ASG39_22695 [Rhizobium sp. Leaf371]|nr:hypothetical protein ASG39_22695 [Rhizobium sp. Leaf371]